MWDNAMLQLSCNIGESKWNPYWFIVLTISSDIHNIPNEREDFDQYDPYVIPSKLMPGYSYLTSLVNQ